jgi:hypothetical protein
LLELAAPADGNRPIDVVARRVTLRGGCPLIAVRLSIGQRLAPSLSLTLEECVADLGPAALVEFLAQEAPDDWPLRLQITGESTVVPPAAHIVGLRSAPDRLRPLPLDNVAIEGLLASEFAFAGPADGDPRNSLVTGFAGYGRSEGPPGIDPKGLPPSRSRPYNSTAPQAPDAPAPQ